MIGLRSKMVLSAILFACVPMACHGAATNPAMCLSANGVTPHKDKGLMCFKSNGVCTCHEADFGGGWPETPINPGEPGWYEHQVNQRFIDDLHNELLTAKGQHRAIVKYDLRNFTNSLKAAQSMRKP